MADIWIDVNLDNGKAIHQWENDNDTITVNGLADSELNSCVKMWLMFSAPSGKVFVHSVPAFCDIPSSRTNSLNLIITNRILREYGKWGVQAIFVGTGTIAGTNYIQEGTSPNTYASKIKYSYVDGSGVTQNVETGSITQIIKDYNEGNFPADGDIVASHIFDFYVHESVNPIDELVNSTSGGISDDAIAYLQEYLNNLVEGELANYILGTKRTSTVARDYGDETKVVTPKGVVEFVDNKIQGAINESDPSSSHVPTSYAVAEYVETITDRLEADIYDELDEISVALGTKLSKTANVINDLNQAIPVGDVYVPSAAATKTYLTDFYTLITQMLANKVNTSDVSNDISGDASSLTKVPSVKAMKDYVDGEIPTKVSDLQNDANYISPPTVWVSLPTTASSGSAQSGIIGNASVYQNTITVSQSNLELFEAVITALNSQDDVHLNSNSYPLAKTPNPSDSNYGSLYYNAEAIPVSSGGDGWSTLRRTDTTKPVFAIILSQDQQNNDVIYMYSSNAFTNGEWDVIYTGDYLTQNTATELFDQRYIPKSEIVTAQSDITTYASSTSKVTSVKAIKEYVDSAISTAIGNAIGGSY